MPALGCCRHWAAAGTGLLPAVGCCRYWATAGTDANVSCVLRGEGGDSGVLHLGISTEHVDKFERAQTDSFDFNVKVWRPTACGRALKVGSS